MITAIHDKDILVMQCAILVIGVSFAVINLIVDMIFILLDQKLDESIKYQNNKIILFLQNETSDGFIKNLKLL